MKSQVDEIPEVGFSYKKNHIPYAAWNKVFRTYVDLKALNLSPESGATIKL